MQHAGLLRRRPGYYVACIAAAVGAFAGLWALFAVLGNSWFQLVVAGLLAAVGAQIGYLAHDGAHRQMFQARWCNEWVARVLAGAFAGLSFAWWAGKHNRHHGAPNQEGKDPDIAAGVIAFTDSAATGKRGVARFLVRRQGWYFFPLLLLEGLHLHVSSLRELIRRPDARWRRVELAMIAARLAGYLAVVLLFLPPGKAAAFVGVQLAALGVLLGGSFAPNHIGMPTVPRGTRLDFLHRQTLMSRNISGGALTSIAMGGLNYQIEHHLFPSMPRPHLRKAAPLVRQFCAEHGIPYTQTTLMGAYRAIWRHLNEVGLRAADPYACPLASTLRQSVGSAR